MRAKHQASLEKKENKGVTDIENKFIQLFGASPKDCLSYLSTARAEMVYKYQKEAFELGVEVGMKWEIKDE